MTQFEKEILDWVAGHYADAALGTQLNNVKVLERRWTGHGCYTELSAPKGADGITEFYGSGGPLQGPNFSSPAVEHGGGTLLWFEIGKVTCLEIYTYTGGFPEDHKDLGDFKIAGGAS